MFFTTDRGILSFEYGAVVKRARILDSFSLAGAVALMIGAVSYPGSYAQTAGDAVPAVGAAKSAPAAQATISGDKNDAQTGAMNSLVTLRAAAAEGQRIFNDINDVNRTLDDAMMQISYPALLPAISDGPITLATPDPKLYTGHFMEARSRSVIAEIKTIGEELALFNKYIAAAQIPDDKRAGVKAILDDINVTTNYVNSLYAGVQNLVAVPGSKIDGEVIAVKLTDMQKSLVTVDYDLKAVFQICNLQGASPETVNALTDLRILSRDAHWLGCTSKYLKDNASELNADAAIIQDAQDQNWLVFGTPKGGYKGLNKDPYVALGPKLISKRMNDIGEYVTAVKGAIEAFRAPAGSGLKPTLSEMQKDVSEIEESYKKLQQLTSVSKLDRVAIAKEAENITKISDQLSKQAKQVGDELMKGKSILNA